MDSVVTGYKDGSVKIHSVDKYYESSNFKSLLVRDSIDAFPLSNGKKASVSKVKIDKKTGALFASSHSGILKLVRPNV
jgi:hypothetical protein